MFDYEEYEKECNAIRSKNDELLDIFETDLFKTGLSKKTIHSHLSNVDFYINTYLLREDAHPMEDGLGMADMFFGDFFIRKCMWSTPGNIKTTAASIKKFYKCMLDHNQIKKKDHDFFCDEIKTGMPVWQADCEQFNDPDSPNPFSFF